MVAIYRHLNAILRLPEGELSWKCQVCARFLRESADRACQDLVNCQARFGNPYWRNVSRKLAFEPYSILAGHLKERSQACAVPDRRISPHARQVLKPNLRHLFPH